MVLILLSSVLLPYFSSMKETLSPKGIEVEQDTNTNKKRKKYQRKTKHKLNKIK